MKRSHLLLIPAISILYLSMACLFRGPDTERRHDDRREQGHEHEHDHDHDHDHEHDHDHMHE